MRESSSHVFPFARCDTSRYRVRVLADVELTPDGVHHGRGDDAGLLAWSRVRRALTAEVGEPEGVRTVVFDLVLDGGEDGWEVCRFDSDPHEDAMQAARAIETGVGAERTAASIKSVATDGTCSRWYPDLESFTQAALAELRDQPS